jgi:hypothetical protein
MDSRLRGNDVTHYGITKKPTMDSRLHENDRIIGLMGIRPWLLKSTPQGLIQGDPLVELITRKLGEGVFGLAA